MLEWLDFQTLEQSLPELDAKIFNRASFIYQLFLNRFMRRQIKHFYEFGAFQIDTVNRRLTCEGELVPLKAKAVETLLVLLEYKGDVVEKDDLMNRLWEDSFVEESNLTQNIYTLRKALGSGGGQYIETVPRRGYRFTAEVIEWEEEDAATAAAASLASDELVLVKEKTKMTFSFEEETDDSDALEPENKKEPTGAEAAISQTALKQITKDKPYAAFYSRKGLRQLILGLMVIGAVALGAFAFFWSRASKIPFENAKLAKLTTTGNVLKAAVSPDRKYLAYVANEANQQSMWLRQIATGKDLQITAPAKTDFYGLTFSHDGNYLYYVSQEMNHVGMLYRMPILGGTPSKLSEDVDSPVTLSPDDRRLAFIRYSPEDRALIVANADGTRERKLIASVQTDSFALAPEWMIPPDWSPDGKTIACAVGVAAPEEGGGGTYETIWGFDAEDATSRPLTEKRWEEIGRMEWLADESGLIITAAEQGTGFVRQIWHVAYPQGAARKITNDLNDYRDLSVARDGKTLIAVQAERRANINVSSDADLNLVRQVTFTNYDGLNGLAWTPDDKIIYTRRATDGQNLWMTDPNGGEPKQLIEHAGFIIQPTVSPDNRYIVFASSSGGQSHIWRADIDGRNLLELTRGVDDRDPTVTADSQSVIFKARFSGKGNIFRVGINGGEVARLMDKISYEPLISPDGQTLAFGYRAAPAAPNKMAVMPALSNDSSEPRLICDLPAYFGRFVWTPDGKSLAYAAKQYEVGNIWIQPLDGSAPRQLTFWKPDPVFSFGWSRDGKKLAFASGTQTSDVVSINDVQY